MGVIKNGFYKIPATEAESCDVYESQTDKKAIAIILSRPGFAPPYCDVFIRKDLDPEITGRIEITERDFKSKLAESLNLLNS